jgi:histidinol dehydrogenase
MRIINATELKDEFFQYKELTGIASVQKIISDVKNTGDEAVKYYTSKYDGVTVDDIEVKKHEIQEAYSKVDENLISTIQTAAEHVRNFSMKQLDQFEEFEIEIVPGVFAQQRVAPIQRIGIYIPGGRFPLVSTLIMCAVPAQVANVGEIILCSPPRYAGSIHPAILVTADILGINELYRIGGVQAIAAMAYGTQSVKKVDKIVGPGNKFVTLAKKDVYGVVGIDFIAGPTEIVIIADSKADPKIIAADLIAQAEHDIDAIAVLITDSIELARKVKEDVDDQLRHVKTEPIAKKALEKNGVILIVKNMDEAVSIANKKAPEHIQLQIQKAKEYVRKLKNFGSLFIGECTGEILGDYSSGINHTLPTNTCARYTAGLSVNDFVRLQTTLRVTQQGLKRIGPIARTLAETEGLDGHSKSILIREHKQKSGG